MEPFTITLAEHVIITVTPCHPNGRDLQYLINIEGKNHGYIIPDIDNEIGPTWWTNDDIHPVIINAIGRLIDNHEA